MSNYSKNNDFKDILNRLLSNVDDTLDKRQGSIIYDALAPAAAELAQCYIALDVFTDQTYLLNAVGENLDARVADYGLTRYSATVSKKQIKIYDNMNEYMDVPIGTKFSIPNEYGGYVFVITEKSYQGIFIGECETPGIGANSYIGAILPLTSINNLGQALITATLTPGENEESDEELRQRAILKLRQKPFAGNKAAYIEMVDDIEGVQACKVFSATSYGGNPITIAVVAADYTIPSTSFISYIQNLIDPLQFTGKGEGLAPIGHRVSIIPVEPYTVDIQVSVSLNDLDEEDIINRVTEYFKEIQAGWEKSTYRGVYIDSDNADMIITNSRIVSKILENPNISDVSVKLNNVAGNLTVYITAEHPRFPVLGEVTVSAII